MSTYESERQENIKRNRALIKELGLEGGNTSASKPKPPPRKKLKTTAYPVPSRTSARLASIPVRPTYTSPPTSPRPHKRKSKAALPTTPSPSPSPSPAPDAQSLISSWTSWSPSGPPPTRDDSGTIHFSTHPIFTPNKTPAEVLREGAFGGSYYRPWRPRSLGLVVEDDWKELPEEWLHGLDVARYLTGGTEGVFDPEVNKYGVKAGQSLEDWEKAGWMNFHFDARGWFQWYTRFYMGRRCDDDDRQIGRWARCVGDKGRWRRVLLKQYLQRGIRSVMDEEGGEGGTGGQEVSPIVSQTGLQWAWEVKQDELDEIWEHGL